jgi:hypothetical protein
VKESARSYTTTRDLTVKLASALEVTPEALLEGIAWQAARLASGGFDVSESGPASEAD